MPTSEKWRHHGARSRAVVLNEGSGRVKVAYGGVNPIPRKTVYSGGIGVISRKKWMHKVRGLAGT